MAGIPSTSDPDNYPTANEQGTVSRRDTGTLGPSDSSDSGSDVANPAAARRIGDADLDAGSDRFGTGERSAADLEGASGSGADVGVDRVIDADEAALGGGLDQAEEARLTARRR
ncbi:MAG: chemotaxis protein [Lautropia sp.]